MLTPIDLYKMGNWLNWPYTYRFSPFNVRINRRESLKLSTKGFNVCKWHTSTPVIREHQNRYLMMILAINPPIAARQKLIVTIPAQTETCLHLGK